MNNNLTGFAWLLPSPALRQHFAQHSLPIPTRLPVRWVRSSAPGRAEIQLPGAIARALQLPSSFNLPTAPFLRLQLQHAFAILVSTPHSPPELSGITRDNPQLSIPATAGVGVWPMAAVVYATAADWLRQEH
jgi:hypothetical protein